jgi:chromosome segregation ATPase
VLVLWGGVLGLLRLVDLYERRHILGLGAYTSLVAALIMGLVLYNAYERQKESRRELQEQMQAVTQRLSELSERLVGQLAEKADLTASEFEIRAKLQNEQAHHERTRNELAAARSEYEELEGVLARERAVRQAYQQEQNQRLEERFRLEEERYAGIRQFLDRHLSTIQGMQKQLASLQQETSQLKTDLSGVASAQNSLVGRVGEGRQLQDLNAQKIEALARSQAALYDDLLKTMAQVDSLYTWRKK